MPDETKSTGPRVGGPRTPEATRPIARNRGVAKKALLIRMLRRKAGADVGAISGKLGWLPHTTRAALSGLRKSGYEVTSEKPEGGRSLRYRIAVKSATDGD